MGEEEGWGAQQVPAENRCCSSDRGGGRVTALRRPGARWRLLVHEYVGGGMYGVSHHVEPGPDRTSGRSDWRRHHELPGSTEFDELVVGSWLHVEALDATTWMVRVAGLHLTVSADRDGRPTRITAMEFDDNDGAITHDFEAIA